ncbi:MAG: MerR family transcriptional regulator [Pseudomonadota bacterium]|nr:MerR family transcriptional regulator [Pseudomonadota bacterium]
MPAKNPDAFRTISEAADEIGVPQHVLRFWETKFSFVRPMKRAGGRRFYRPQDIQVLRGVRVLLHDEGYTIKGVQRLHKEQGVRRLVAASRGEGGPPLAANTDEPEMETAEEAAPDFPAELPAMGRGQLQALLEELLESKFKLDAALQRIA